MTKRTPGIFLQRSRVVGRRRLKKARVQVCLRREINTEEKQLTPVWLSSFCDDVFSSLSLWSEFAAHAVCRQVIRPISSTANWAILVTAASRYSREYTEQKLAVMLPSIVLEPPSNSHHVLLLLLLRLYVVATRTQQNLSQAQSRCFPIGWYVPIWKLYSLWRSEYR